MEPISVIVGVSAVGYLLDQYKNIKNFNSKQKQSIPTENISACAEQYPWNFVENFQDSNNNNNNEISPLTPQPIESPTSINAINNAGEPPADYLLNANQRPVEDFVVNNMVPFFRGSGTNQDMRGTGVAQGNVDFDDFNTGNQGFTPNYTQLGTFTGFDNTYLHKREAPNMFSPLERRDANTIPGEQPESQRPILDRFTTSILTKNEQAPIERQQVGPGLNIDPNMPNDGQGFNSGLQNRVMPNNVNAYRLSQFGGMVRGTSAQTPGLPTALPGTGPALNSDKNSMTTQNNGVDQNLDNLSENMYGVPSKNKTPYWTMEDRPLSATPGGSVRAPMIYSNPVMPSGTDKRTTTNVEFGQSVKIN